MNFLPKEAEPGVLLRLIFEPEMNRVPSNIDTPQDRIRYALNRANQTEMSWSARELFSLVKIFFPTETRSSISAGVATLCSCGDFPICGRRYTAKALKLVSQEGFEVGHHSESLISNSLT